MFVVRSGLYMSRKTMQHGSFVRINKRCVLTKKNIEQNKEENREEHEKVAGAVLLKLSQRSTRIWNDDILKMKEQL